MMTARLVVLAVVLPALATADSVQGFTAKCEASVVHRYDSQEIWDKSVSSSWSTDEICCSITVVYTGAKTLMVNDRELPIVALSDEGYLVAIDVTNTGWEAGAWIYAASPDLKEVVATEAKSFGHTPALRARAIQYKCEFIHH